jgi:hypothetical protein
LPLEWDFARLRFAGQALLVYRLEQPWTERAADGEGGSDGLAANQVVLRKGFSHLGALALNWNRAFAQNRYTRNRNSARTAIRANPEPA